MAGPLPVRARRLRLLALVALVPASFAAVAIAGASTAYFEDSNSAESRQPAAAAAPAAALPAAPADHAPAQAEPDQIRFTGRVGADLTQSLRAAGVAESEGREYVATLAKVIELGGGLSVEDRFDLVVVHDEQGARTLAFAGLDRVGRSDVELMKWTDGKEVRWIDAGGLDPSAQGMMMPVGGRVSSGFGQRFHPVLRHRRMHSGVDVAAPYGAPVVAAADGQVTSAGWSGGYGRQVAIAHRDGIRTTYSHMSRIAASPGTLVRQGQVIGYVGSSGLSTGPHLHYEVYKDGRRVNPLSVKLARSPLQDEELHAFRSRLRGLLTSRPPKRS